MKTIYKVILGIFIFFIIGLGVILFVPFSSKQVPEPQITETNTFIHAKLIEIGLSDILVDYSNDRVLVRYNEPKSFTNRTQIFLIVANESPLAKKIVLQVFDNFIPRQELTADTSIVYQLKNGLISEEQFNQSITKAKLE